MSTSENASSDLLAVLIEWRWFIIMASDILFSTVMYRYSAVLCDGSCGKL
jgi:hypothetical protein